MTSFQLIHPELAPRPCKRSFNHPYKWFVGKMILVSMQASYLSGGLKWTTEHAWVEVTKTVGRGASLRLVGKFANDPVNWIRDGKGELFKQGDLITVRREEVEHVLVREEESHEDNA